jgi:hypothetical protein
MVHSTQQDPLHEELPNKLRFGVSFITNFLMGSYTPQRALEGKRHGMVRLLHRGTTSISGALPASSSDAPERSFGNVR